MKLKSQYSLIVTVFGTLLCVHFIVSVIWDRSESIASSQWGQNTIRSEKVLYSNVSNSCVLVGSSMSARLDFTPHNREDDAIEIYNLAFAGDSAITGLELLLTAEKYPTCVLVETNLSYRLADQSTVEDLTSGIWRPLKQWYPPLRHENQPINQLLTFIKYLREIGKSSVLESEPVGLGAEGAVRSDVSLDMIDKRIEGLSNIKHEDLELGVTELIRLCRQLADNSVTVVLVEIPGEPQVRNTTYYSALRSILRSQISDNNSSGLVELYQPFVDFGFVATSDGIHLVGNSIEKVSEKIGQLANAAVSNL